MIRVHFAVVGGVNDIRLEYLQFLSQAGSRRSGCAEGAVGFSPEFQSANPEDVSGLLRLLFTDANGVRSIPAMPSFLTRG
jgi:hypothetical protein